MKKFIYFMMFFGITTVNAQRTDFGVYTINAPAVGATLHHGKVHLAFVVINKTSIGVANSDSVYLWARINSTGTPVMVDAYSQLYLIPNGSLNLESDLLYLDSSVLPEGNYQLGLGLYWKKNPNSGAIVYVYNNFYFSHASGIEESTVAISSIYYSNGSLYLKIFPKVDQNGKLLIYDFAGQLIKSCDIVMRAGSELSENIPIKLPSGIYLVTLRTDKSVSSCKFNIR